jgi:N-acetylmuramoyl-L-alanine amidase
MTIKNKYLLLVFILVLGLVAFSVSSQAQPSTGLKLKTVVIDAGHGGKDVGAVSKDRKTYEKNINLKISILLRDMLKEAYPDMKVILTRNTDVYLTLNERAEIANKNNADLFVSIHTNSVSSTSPRGFSTHIFGQDKMSQNMELCKRENSVILLEDDYTTKYQGFDPTDTESYIFFSLMQKAYYEQSLLFAIECDKSMAKGPVKHSRGVSQDPFYVLWKTSMPSVLVEVGFISNTSDVAVFRQDSGLKGIAATLFDAVSEFKKHYDKSLVYEDAPAAKSEVKVKETVPETPVVQESRQDVVPVIFGTQVLVSSSNLKETDSRFKGYDCVKLKSGNLYKYIIGISESEQKAKELNRKIKQTFPDSFMVKVQDGKAIRN